MENKKKIPHAYKSTLPLMRGLCDLLIHCSIDIVEGHIHMNFLTCESVIHASEGFWGKLYFGNFFKFIHESLGIFLGFFFIQE